MISLIPVCGTLEWWSPTFLEPGTAFAEDSFPQTKGWKRDGFWMIRVFDIPCALYFYDFYIMSIIILFLLLLYQFHLRSPGIRHQRLGIPTVGHPSLFLAVNRSDDLTRK